MALASSGPDPAQPQRTVPPPNNPDDAAADEQSGWVTLALYGLGLLLYLAIGEWKLGLINFPPAMLVCMLATGWAGPILWRRLHR